MRFRSDAVAVGGLDRRIERGAGLVGAAGAGEHRHQPLVGLPRLRDLLDQGAVERLGLVGLALDGVHAGAREAAGLVLGVLGEDGVDLGAGGLDVVGGEMRLGDGELGADVVRALGGDALDGGDELLGLALGLEHGEVEVGGDLIAGGGSGGAQGVGDLAGAQEVAALQVDLAEQGEQLHVVGRAVERVERHGLGLGLALLREQEAGVADRLVGAVVGGLEGAGEALADEVVRALALMRLGHDRVDLRVAGVFLVGGVEVEERLLGDVVGDVAAGAQLQRLDVAAVGLEHRVDERVALLGLAGLEQHAGEADLQVADVGGRFGALGEGAQRGDGLVAVAELEVELGERAQERAGFGAGVDLGLELLAGGLGAFGLQAELGDVEVAGRVVGGLVGGLAQERQRGLGVAAGHVPLQQRLRHLGVVGEELRHLHQLFADGLVVAELFEGGEAGEVQVLAVGDRLERGVGLGERGLEVLRRPEGRRSARAAPARCRGSRTAPRRPQSPPLHDLPPGRSRWR